MAFENKFLRNNIIMFASTGLVNFANLLYQLLIVRKLSVADYGAFNSLLAAFTVISFPIASLITMIAKYAASYNHTGERPKADFFLSILLRHMFFTGVSFLAIYLVFGTYFKNYLHLDSVLPVYLTGGMLFLSCISTVALGGLQGLERFIWLSAGNVISALFKLFLAFLFLSAGWDILGALGAFLASQIIVLLIASFPLREIFYANTKISGINLREKYRFIIPSLITFGCFTALTNMDVVFVKHFFEPIRAGYYSVAQLIGKISLFVPAAMYIVMLPRASGLHAQKKDSVLIFKKSLIYTAILCLFAAAIYNLFPRFLLNLLTGKVNDEIIFLGRLFSISMAFFSMLFIALLYQLSVSKFKFLKSLVLFTLLQVLVILTIHFSPAQILFVSLLNSIILFGINFKLAITQ